jgi:hypothetical protein
MDQELVKNVLNRRRHGLSTGSSASSDIGQEIVDQISVALTGLDVAHALVAARDGQGAV